MTPLQDKLRAALRETADEIPAQAPPLRLSPQRGGREAGTPGGAPGPCRWPPRPWSWRPSAPPWPWPEA